VRKRKESESQKQAKEKPPASPARNIVTLTSEIEKKGAERDRTARSLKREEEKRRKRKKRSGKESELKK
jgi:hypothetical protein